VDDRIISNIKNALASSAVSGASCDVSDGRLVEKDMSTNEKVLLFEVRAGFSGSKVHIVDGDGSLKTILNDIIGSDSSVMSALQQASIDKIGDIKSLIADNCKYFGDGSLEADRLFNVDVAITDVTLAVAETGSILIDPSDLAPRMKSLVCTKHIALIWADQICSDLMDVSEYLGSLNSDELPGGFNLISGPSKTADIELS